MGNPPGISRTYPEEEEGGAVRRVPSLLVVSAVLTGALVGADRADRADAADPLRIIEPTIETEPASHTGDSMDDPAVWVHPTDPAGSLVLVNDKQGSLDSYDLTGRLVQRLQDSVTFWGNVDVRSARSRSVG
jgi:myo-inositol-hexaphosphate 3-phosphohydrolase